MKKCVVWHSSWLLFLCAVAFASPSSFGYMIDPRGYAFPPYSVLDGVDARGHALYVKQIGEIRWAGGTFPIVVCWNSGNVGVSPFLGAGWSLPIAESRIVPIDPDRFVMRQPDGDECRFSRNPKKPNEIQSGVHRWQGRVSGDRVDVWTHPDAPGAIGGHETSMRFRNGRLVELRMRNAELTFKYEKGLLKQVLLDDRIKLEIVRSRTNPNEWVFEFAGGKKVVAVLGKAPFTSNSRIREADAVKELRFDGSTSLSFDYTTPKDGRVEFSASGMRFVWDEKRRTLLEKDGWKYEIGVANPEGNNTPMRRVNSDGAAEQEFYDLNTGYYIKEDVCGTKIVERRFTSGRFFGKTRWSEYYRKGVLDYRVELSYDDMGRVVYSRYKYGLANTRYKGVREYWFNDAGKILRIRENEDKKTDQEYIYTPEGINVGVVSGDRVVSSQVANMDDFVRWHRARKSGENLSCPKIVSVSDAPLPVELRKVIPDWLFQKLTAPKGADD